MKLQEHDHRFDPVNILDHLYDIHVESSTPSTSFSSDADSDDANPGKLKKAPDTLFIDEDLVKYGVKVKHNVRSLHHCQNKKNCPLQFIHYSTKTYLTSLTDLRHVEKRNKKWSQEIYNRGIAIRQSMHFLTDLIMDWSSRVWVISEFHISKKKNNLRWWFHQLTPSPPSQDNNDSISQYPISYFFKFDIHDIQLEYIRKTNIKPRSLHSASSDPVYLTFYHHLVNQLTEQTFLEMVLKSKASKNEDRIYSVFPQFPEYKDILSSNNNNNNGKKEDLVKSWNVTSILSVKLKLYQVMKNEDKTLLLYLSAMGKPTHSLPTFATSTINWRDHDYKLSHVDEERGSVALSIDITLRKKTIDDDDDDNHHHDLPLYYLHLKPIRCARALKDPDVKSKMTWGHFLPPHRRQTLCERLQLLDDGNHCSKTFDLVKVPTKLDRYGNILELIWLIGSFKKNIWILGNNANGGIRTEYYECRAHIADDGFHVY